MTEYQPFLDAICDSPADDAPRLVFADWLEEHGECARAEFIRVQCELEEKPPCPDWCDGDPSACRVAFLERREQQLLYSYRREWLLPLMKILGADPGVSLLGTGGVDVTIPAFPQSGRYDATFRRGFVATISCTLADWCGGPCERCDGDGIDALRRRQTDTAYYSCEACNGTGTTTGHAGDICLRHPIESVTLTDRRPYCSDGECDFWNADRKGPSHALPEWCNIPSVLFFMLDGYNPSFNNDRWKAYRAEADALAELNRAAVKLGRERAEKLRRER